MTTHVSIIVPIYNAEKTLTRCLNCLINQTIKDIEIICVNDGSTDNSRQICDEYALTDSRIKVFHKKNEGVSAARQFGIERASGEYIIHLDADDYAEEDAYRKLYSVAKSEDADIAICDALRVFKDHTEYMDFSLKEYSHKEMLKDLVSSFGSVWNRLIRKSIIQEFNVSFPDYLQYGEDKVFLATLLGKSYGNGRRFKICHIPEPLIYYDTTSNDNSLSNLSPGIFVKKRMTMLTKVGEVIDLKEFGQAYFSHIFQEAYSVLRNISYYGYSEEDYISTFKLFHQGIKDHTPFSLKKVLVNIALDRGYKTALRWRWILIPNILLDKIKRWIIKQ